MIEVVARLQNYVTEYRGSSNFTKCYVNVDLQTDRSKDEIPLQFVANGSEGDRANAILGNAPEGTLVRIGARPTFRRYNENTFLDLELVDLDLLGSIGTLGANFRFQGFIDDIEERTSDRGKGGSFFIGHLKMVAFDRDGAIPDARINMLINSDAVDAWRVSQGKYTMVTGTMAGTRNKNNPKYVYPRFVAQGVNGSIATPAWLVSHAPQAAMPVAQPVSAVDVPF